MSSGWIARAVPAAAGGLAASGLPRRTAELLALRGISDPESATAFLAPELAQLHDPLALRGMAEALELLHRMHATGGSITVFGDYDVDGVTATALLAGSLGALGFNVRTMLPSRQAEGYGLQIRHVREAVASGCDLLLTADCGTTSFEAIAEANAAGLAVVVTDHHRVGDVRPAVAALINPQQAECDYPFRDLSGAGVAFKLAAALFASFARQVPWEGLLRLACLGTIADAMPLVGENRVIARWGLDALPRSPSPGLRALFAAAKLRAPFSAVDVGFRIGPRLNAPGRVGDPGPALEILLTRDAARGRELAAELEAANGRRQELERRIVAECEDRFPGSGSEKFLIGWSAEWHRGVVGIAAGRLSRLRHRPAILFACGADGVAVGSGRSVEGFDLHALVETLAPICLRFGGHSQAIGLSVETARLPEFAQRLRAIAEAADIPLAAEERPREYDVALAPGELDRAFLAELDRLAPFGTGNPEPLLRVGPLRCAGSPRYFGNGHLAIRAEDRDRNAVSIVAWSGAESSSCAALSGDEEFEILGTAEADRFDGGVRLVHQASRPLTGSAAQRARMDLA